MLKNVKHKENLIKEDAVSSINPLGRSVPSGDKIVIDFDFIGKNGAGK